MANGIVPGHYQRMNKPPAARPNGLGRVALQTTKGNTTMDIETALEMSYLHGGRMGTLAEYYRREYDKCRAKIAAMELRISEFERDLTDTETKEL